jgi:hypothetical protein
MLYIYSHVTCHAAPGIYLEDLYGLPSERRNGHEKRLMNALGQESNAVGGARIEWGVLGCNESSIRFYESMGVKVMVGWKDRMLDKTRAVQ